MISFGKYSKFIVAAAAFVYVVATALLDGKLSGDEIEAIAIAAGVAGGVFGVTNR